MQLVIISDTHNNRLQKLPDGDVLVHAGDLTALGRHGETQKQLDHLAKFHSQFKHIVLVAGNHDFLAQKENPLFTQMCQDRGITYLEDSGINLGGFYFYGTPWTPTFYNWAFMESEADLVRRFRWIPEDTDVLITHGPPRYILDQNGYGEHCGSMALLERVKQVKPKVHVFGHIHDSHGTLEYDGTTFVNAAQVDDEHQLRANKKPIVVEV